MKPALFLFATCLDLLARPALHAQATITWGTPTAISGPTDVLTTGTFVAAASAFGSASTVNGVSFAAYNATSSFTYTGTRASYHSETYPPTNTGDSAYNDILNIGFHSLDDGSATLTLSGLTAGQQYRGQLWTPSWDITWSTSFSSGNQVAMGNTALVPTYVTGTFTATGTTQTISYRSSSNTHGVIGAASVL
jgi:hypothetical protein